VGLMTRSRFTPSTCSRCRAITLHGIVAEGLATHLDPTPLDATEEARALVAGRTTWHVTRDLEACWRTASKIRHRPAGNYADLAILATHVCAEPIPTTIIRWAWAPPPRQAITEEPMF